MRKRNKEEDEKQKRYEEKGEKKYGKNYLG